jgi:hypothetical protein
VSQDALLQSAELVVRLQSELARQRPAGVPVDRQRIGLAPRAVQREHQLSAEALVQRMLGDELFQLRNDRVVSTELEVGVDSPLEQLEPQLLEAEDLRPCERHVCELRKRRPAPESERLVQQHRTLGSRRFCRKREGRLRPVGVDRRRVDGERVAGRNGGQGALASTLRRCET